MSTKITSSSCKQRVDAANVKVFANEGRAIMSRVDETSISIVKTITPGKKTNSCFVCCNAPSCCAICSICPCCDYSDFLVKRRESSKYFHVRENSIEWNAPEIIMRDGNCFGIDPCIFDVQDNAKVLYFDDPMFMRLTNTTRLCNEFWSCLCGGRGERLQISSTCCFGMGYRGKCPCLCIPICCPHGTFFQPDLFGCISAKIYLE
jgi:hypothetical protein